MAAQGWQDLCDELDRWTSLGLKARFWLRDDDACEPSSQLEALGALADRYNINIGLAVIPATTTPALVRELLGSRSRFHPMCHGWNHTNYGRDGRPEEFGEGRPLAALRQDATQAFRVFSEYFGSDDMVFVPPFGRIASAFIADLPRIGFAALSTGPAFPERAALRFYRKWPWIPIVRLPTKHRFLRCDVHIDVIDWQRRTARAVGSVAAELVANLQLRRKGFLPAGHPIGLLTHHLVHDKAIWECCDEMLQVLSRHQGAQPVNAADLVEFIKLATPRERVGLASADT